MLNSGPVWSWLFKRVFTGTGLLRSGVTVWLVIKVMRTLALDMLTDNGWDLPDWVIVGSHLGGLATALFLVWGGRLRDRAPFGHIYRNDGR